MSIEVELDRLEREVGRRGSHAFVLTVSDDGRPHATAVSVAWAQGALVAAVGGRTGGNALARPDVSLLWAASDAEGFSLIVDGMAESPGEGGGRLTLRPTKAVLHRARPAGDGSSTSECETLLPRRTG